MSQPEGRATQTCTFRTSMRAGVWQVTRDKVFYGDYPTREAALESACSAARSVEAGGGAARVLTPSGEAVIPHHEPRLES